MQDPNRTQMGSPPTADPNKTMMGSAPSLNVTTTIKPVQCPVCKAFNPPGVAWCNDCGLIFEMALPGDAFGAPAVQLPVLVEATGREHQLRPGANVVGRAGDIVIDDTRVSRRHCQIDLNDGAVTVLDLGSTNGTTVAGQRLGAGESRTLGNAERVSLGGFELTLSLPGEANKTLQAMSGRTSAMAAPPTTSDAPVWLVLPDREEPLRPGQNTFGRRDGNSIVIADPYVSGSHGVIEVADDGVYLTDTGSTNGTLLNEAKIAPNMRTKVSPDDTIRLGSLEIKIRLKDS
ncbi:MAG: FHA domain-containing protein [Fimbriimonadaceae bacterium]|nr:FHA domain-containing protein [Fimbriimonadaceae bacterium]QYK59687.1 MAG: FHA domain-containing protein [Fimbriimonadaceae bacterium]